MNFSLKVHPKIRCVFESHSTSLVFLTLAGIGFLIYANTLDAGFHFDDIELIRNNPAFRNLENFNGYCGGVKITRCLPLFTFACHYHFFQYEVLSYHLVNILIHIISSFLVYLLMLGTFETPALENHPLARRAKGIAWVAALIFLAHPIQTQAVTYIWQRTASLATLFYLASVVFFIRARLKSSWTFYGMAWLAMGLGLFTKEIIVTLPFTLFLYDFTFFGSWNRGDRKRWIFLGVLFVGLLGVAVKLLMSGELKCFYFKIHRYNGRLTPVGVDYLLTELNVMRTYLRLLFLPVRQVLDYYYPISRNFFESRTFLSFLLHVGILLSALRLYGTHKIAAFGIFWFYITLLPESSLIPLRDVIFEHRLYLPMAGFSLFLSASMASWIRNPQQFSLGAWVIVIILSVLTFRRNEVWHDEFSLWEDVVKKVPQNPRAYHNLAAAYAEKGGTAESAIPPKSNAVPLMLKADTEMTQETVVLRQRYREYCRRAITFYRKAYVLGLSGPEITNNLAAAYNGFGRHKFARHYIRKALRLNPHEPKINYNMALFGISKFRTFAREKYYRRALRYHQAYLKSRSNRAAVDEKIIEDYQKMIRSGKNDSSVFNNLGVAYERIGQDELAEQYFQQASALHPKDSVPYYNLGVIAAKAAEKVWLSFESQSTMSRYFVLGSIYGAMVSPEESGEHTDFLEMDRGIDEGQAFNNLGIVYLEMDKGSLAWRYLAKAIKKGKRGRRSYKPFYNRALLILKSGNPNDFPLFYQNAYRRNSYAGLPVEAVRNYAKAIDYYIHAISLGIRESETFNNLGALYEKTGEEDLAARYFRQALRRDARNFNAYYNLGNLASKTGDFKQAVKFYQKAIRYHPCYAQAYHNLAMIFGIQGNRDQEVKLLQKAVRCDPQYAEAYSNLAYAYAEAGEWEKAIEHYQKAVTLRPHFTQAYYYLGLVYTIQGKRQEAQRQADALRQLNENQWADQLEQMMENPKIAVIRAQMESSQGNLQ
ncbi:MAG: tetratricopeptide repeat protein [Candidatus Omnitrophica bacterium]|nr:tetratricopeptide repeat protein [Candidatus Omnitrophota bacterium]